MSTWTSIFCSSAIECILHARQYIIYTCRNVSLNSVASFSHIHTMTQPGETPVHYFIYHSGWRFIYSHSLLLEYSHLDIPATWYSPLPEYIDTDTPSSSTSGTLPVPKSFKYDGLQFTESALLGTHDKDLITTNGCLTSPQTSLGCYPLTKQARTNHSCQ